MSDSKFKVIPDAQTLALAVDIEILDVKGQKVKFGKVIEGEQEKTIVVFIRHFFCGAYVENLTRVPQETLQAAKTRIVVIGCGQWEPIQAYHDTTNFQGPIYADPSRALYHALGMTLETLAVTPADQPKPSYLSHVSRLGNTFLSIWRGPLKHPNLIGKQGNISQLGGEFVFGHGNTCILASRMQHTEDHVPVVELMKAAGVEYEE